MTRISEMSFGNYLLIMRGRFSGNLGNALRAYDRRFDLKAYVPRYSLYWGLFPDERMLFQISQGTQLTDPEHVIISVQGADQHKVDAKLEDLLAKVPIREVDVPESALRAQLELAKLFLLSGAVPEWLRPLSSP